MQEEMTEEMSMTHPRRRRQPNHNSPRSIAIEPEATPWCVVGCYQGDRVSAPAAPVESRRSRLISTLLVWSLTGVLVRGRLWTVKLAVGLL